MAFQKGHIPWNKNKKGIMKAWNKGKEWSLEHKKKLSKIHTGKKLSEEHKKNISLSKKGKTPKNIYIIAGWNKGIERPDLSEKYKGKGNPMYGKHAWNYKTHNSGMKGKMHSEETKKRMSLSQSGSNNHRWIKDRSIVEKNKRNDGAYIQWMKTIRKRDSHKCRICGSNKDLQVHHILPWADYPEERYNINNGITLCRAHHPKRRAEEKRLIPLFQGLVSVLNE